MEPPEVATPGTSVLVLRSDITGDRLLSGTSKFCDRHNEVYAQHDWAMTWGIAIVL